MRTTYIYAGRAGTAAHHLLDNSALAGCTEQSATHYAGTDCWKVELTTPRPSRGEQILWAALDSLARADGTVDVNAAAEWLDAENLRILHEAVGLLFGLVEEPSC